MHDAFRNGSDATAPEEHTKNEGKPRPSEPLANLLRVLSFRISVETTPAIHVQCGQGKERRKGRRAPPVVQVPHFINSRLLL